MTTALVTAALPELADRINAEHRACEQAMNTGLQRALECGRLLIEARGQIKHGEWQQWVADHCEFSSRAARTYMQVAKRWPEIEAKRQRAAVLSYREAVKLLAEPRAEPTAKEKIPEFYREGLANGWLSHEDVLALEEHARNIEDHLLEIGTMLWKIRENGHWRLTHSNFYAWCRDAGAGEREDIDEFINAALNISFCRQQKSANGEWTNCKPTE